MLKLVKNIHHYYFSKKPVVIIAWILQKIITETTGFAKRSTLYTVLVNIKKREKKDWAPTSILESFLEKLKRSKGYVPVEDPVQVNNPNQIFKVFERGIIDE